jgi:hypothetical protein
MFKIEAFQNSHLPANATRLDSVLTVACDAEGAADPSALGVCFIIDRSGSMEDHDKMEAAKHAVRLGIEGLPEAAHFSVVIFNLDAETIVFPTQASRAAKQKAHEAVQHVRPKGGTAMSTGIALAGQNLAEMPVAIRHGIFLTDGYNDENDERDLGRALAAAEGKFQCDCRGIGVDWKPTQLRKIASKLLGNADIIKKPADIAADFRDILTEAMGKGMADVRLRLWTPASVRVAMVKQLQPTIETLTDRFVQANERARDYATGAWGRESRDFQITFELSAGAVGEEMLACRPSVAYSVGGEEKIDKGGNVLVTWTEDEALTTRIDPKVAGATGRGELAASIQEGLEARERGDVDVATQRLGRAAQLASQLGDAEMTQRIAKVVDIDDAATGTVRLRRNVDKADAMDLDMGSVRTVRTKRP